MLYVELKQILSFFNVVNAQTCYKIHIILCMDKLYAFEVDADCAIFHWNCRNWLYMHEHISLEGSYFLSIFRAGFLVHCSMEKKMKKALYPNLSDYRRFITNVLRIILYFSIILLNNFLANYSNCKWLTAVTI